jgi:ATP-dependent DNA helicase RecG
MPPGRQRVDTFAVDESYRERLLAFIRKQADGGGQVYVVCPAVEEREEPEGVEVPLSAVSVLGDAPLVGACEAEYPLKTAVGYAKELQEALPELSVAFLHGRMKAAEKDAVMKEFVAGRVQVLVSTTVIEVGVNVPTATLMIVENAERFGLSQLHQLRGRVGRGKRKSYCVLVSDCMRPDAPGGETARQRLQTMRSVYDGYAVAEKDLELRGPGDFLAAGGDNEIRQSGGLRFRLASLCDDSGVFSDACADAGALRAQDPTLAAYATLRQAVDGLFAADRDALS